MLACDWTVLCLFAYWTRTPSNNYSKIVSIRSAAVRRVLSLPDVSTLSQRPAGFAV